MHITLLQDLAVILLISAIVTVLFHQLKQPVVLGYLIAGFIIGPHTPPYSLVHNEHHTIEALSEIGVVLLMFSLGLHFSLRKLATVGGTAFIAASSEIVLMLVIGYGAGRAFGWNFTDSLFLGALLSISSTTIIVKALEDLKLTRADFAALIFGILIVEDILGIALLALLPSIAQSGAISAGPALETLGRLGIFLTVVLVVGLIAVPRLLRYISRFENDEVLIVTALGICFGVSLLAAHLGYSVALGAFLAGAIIAEAREGPRIGKLAEPVRDMFSAVFFVSVGMLIDPKILVGYAVPIAVLTVVVVVGKVVTCAFGTFIAGHDLRTSLRVGMGLAQIGEFSFIIAALGSEKLKVTSDFLYPLAVAVSAITTLLTPYLIRSSDAVAGAFERLLPRPLLAALQLYGQRMAARQGGDESNAARRRRLIGAASWPLALNIALITGVLIAAAGLPERLGDPWQDVFPWEGGTHIFFWLGAMVLVLPMLVGAVRQLGRLGDTIAQVRIADEPAPERAQKARAVVSATVAAAGTVALGFWIVALSVSILPSWPLLLALLPFFAVVGFLLRRRLTEVNARAHALLEETLAQEAPHHEEPPQLPTMLRAATLVTVELTAESPAAGRLIRELELRRRTGASAVGIDRDGGPVVNPGPDDELRPGDRILLLGSPEQLAKAQTLLTGQPEPAKEAP